MSLFPASQKTNENEILLQFFFDPTKFAPFPCVSNVRLLKNHAQLPMTNHRILFIFNSIKFDPISCAPTGNTNLALWVLVL
jgi:hypothetical protein